MEGKALTATDALALTGGYNNGMFGNNEWMWIFILLFFFRGNGLYGEGTNLASDEFIKRDIFNVDQDVNKTACTTQKDVLESKYATELAIANLGSQMQNCCCETNRNIDSVRYDSLLNFKDVQAQMASCCLKILKKVYKVVGNLISNNKLVLSH